MRIKVELCITWCDCIQLVPQIAPNGITDHRCVLCGCNADLNRRATCRFHPWLCLIFVIFLLRKVQFLQNHLSFLRKLLVPLLICSLSIQLSLRFSLCLPFSHYFFISLSLSLSTRQFFTYPPSLCCETSTRMCVNVSRHRRRQGCEESRSTSRCIPPCRRRTQR